MSISRKRDQLLDQLDAARARFKRASAALKKRKTKQTEKEFILANEALDDLMDEMRRFVAEARHGKLH